MPGNVWKNFKPFTFTPSPQLLLPLAIALGVTALMLIIRGIAYGVLEKGKKGDRRVDAPVTPLSVIRAPSIYWCVAIGLYVGIAFSDIDVASAREMNLVVHVILVLSMTLAAANVSSVLFKNFMAATDHGAKTSGLALGVVKGIVTSVGVLIVLSMLGISIAPILTALGVGGLAVALALKDTLENLFAGLYLITDRAIRVGDFIRLDNGQEGTVEDIGWRTIRVRTQNNNTVILPNSKLAQSSVTNFSLPEKKISSSITFATGLDADITKVENLALEVAKKGTEDIVGLLAYPEPNVRFTPGVGDDSMGFTLNFTAEEFTKQSFVQHELRKRVYRRLVEEKVPMPKKVFGLLPAITTALFLILLVPPTFAIEEGAPMHVGKEGIWSEYYINGRKVDATAFNDLRAKIKIDRAYREDLLESGSVRTHAAKDTANGHKYEFVQEMHEKKVTYRLREVKRRKSTYVAKSKRSKSKKKSKGQW